MLQAIDRHLPAGVDVTPPHGGLFIWLRLPKGTSSTELLPLACERGVAFAPGTAFFVEESGGQPYARLSFVAQEPVDIEAGIARLGKAIERLASH
jgi:DNA-binding transcriptional MocR family regulator